jgi:hypothetical protein
MLVEADLTPPVRRPARREARGVGAVAMALGLKMIDMGENGSELMNRR